MTCFVLSLGMGQGFSDRYDVKAKEVARGDFKKLVNFCEMRLELEISLELFQSRLWPGFVWEIRQIFTDPQ